MVATKRLVRTERGERMDQPDFQRVAERTPIDLGAQLFQGFLTGGDAPPGSAVITSLPKALVIEGFVVTKSALELTITGGKAILTRRVPTGVEQGNLLTGGDTSKTIDMTADPDDTYKVLVRFDLRDDANENRIFWNAAAPTPVENPRNVPTRLVENWNVVVERVAPSDEWIEIASVVKAAGALTVTDTRTTYFEGDPANNHVILDAEWGSAADRADDRAAEGIVGLRRGFRALQRQVQDMVGFTDAGPRHWARAIDATLGLFEMLAKDGARTMDGDFNPDGADTRSFGNLSRWLAILAKVFTGDEIDLGALLLGSNANSLLARVDMDYRDSTNGSPVITGASQSRTLLWEGRALTGTVSSFIRIYGSNAAAQYGSTTAANIYNLEICFNCKYNITAPNDSWIPDSTGAPAMKFDLSRVGLVINHKATPPAGGWRDDGALGDTWDNANKGLTYDAAGRLLKTDGFEVSKDPGLNTTFNNNQINLKNINFAGATLLNTGGTLAFTSHYNCSFSINGSGIDVLFDAAVGTADWMADTQIMSLLPFFPTAFGHLVIASPATSGFTLWLYDIFNAVLVDMHAAGQNNLKFSFTCRGQV